MTAQDKILEVLDSIRPAIQADGGDVEFLAYREEEGVVEVRLIEKKKASAHSSDGAAIFVSLVSAGHRAPLLLGTGLGPVVRFEIPELP